MRELINRLLGKNTVKSKEDAKQRLKFLLIHDQVDLTPGQLEAMKEEIMQVIAKYVQIDPLNTDFRLEKAEGHIALVSSVPVTRVLERPAHA